MNIGKHPAITLILFLVLLTRIVIVFTVFHSTRTDLLEQFYWDADPKIYVAGARHILATGVNRLNFFPPLHFLFLAGCLYLGKGNLLIAALANVTVGWLTVVGIYLLAKDLYGERAGLIAAIISGFYPNFIIYEIALYPEPLALLWIVFSFLMLARYFQTCGSSYLVGGGFLWGLASQTRGGLNYFPVFAGIAIAASLAGRSWKSRCKPMSTFLLAAYLAFLAMGIAAYPLHGNFSFNSKSGIGSVLHGANRITTSCTDYGDVRGKLFYSILKDEWPEGSQIYSRELLNLDAWQIGVKLLRFIAQDPLTYVKNAFTKLSCLWSPNQLIIYYLKTTGFKDADRPIVNGVCLGIGLLYMLIVCGGLYGLSGARGPFRLLFLLFILYYTVLIFLSVGNSKLRLPLMPFLMIYCSYGITRLRDLFRGTPYAHTWITLIMVAIFTGNSIYKCREFLPSPAEVDVREIELSYELGFPGTALHLLKKGHKHPFSGDQKKRMSTVEKNALSKLEISQRLEPVNGIGR